MESNLNANTVHILTDEQLVTMAQEGSKTAEEILIEKYKGLAKAKAKLYYIVGAEAEDVVQEGMIGLFKAIRNFDEEREASFKTYADICINSQIITAIKSANRQKHQPLNESVSLNNTIIDGDIETTAENLLRDSEENNPEALTLIKEVLDCLKAEDGGIFSDFEWKVWCEKLKGRSYVEIAETLGKTPKSIDNALQRIKKKVIAYLEK